LSSVVWAGYVITLALRFGRVLFGKRLAAVCVALFALAMVTLYPVVERHAATAPKSSMKEVR
jgi:hypothetical protein